MAITRVQSATPATASTSGTTLTVTLGSNVPVGHHLIVVAGYSGGLGVTVSFSDAAGNTYTTHETTDDGSSTGAYSAIGSAKVTTQLNAGQTITMTVSSNVTHRILCAYEYSGLDPTTWFDTGANTGKGTSTSPASGSITLAGTELVIGATGYNSGTQTHSPGGSFIELNEAHTSSKGLAVDEWNGGSGTVQHTGTLTSSVLWSDSIAAFIGAGGGGQSFSGSATTAITTASTASGSKTSSGSPSSQVTTSSTASGNKSISGSASNPITFSTFASGNNPASAVTPTRSLLGVGT